MILYLLVGLALMLVGTLVSILFWVPRLVDRARLREILGSRYPLVYLVYSANGPVLVAAGAALLYKYYHSG